MSSFGVIPKNQEGRWTLIVDLSSPGGASVNDGITAQACSLKYIKVDDVAEAILQLGRGTDVAKMQVKSAYRIDLAHPEDR